MDEHLRRLERRFRETGDIEDGKRWVRAALAAEEQREISHYKLICPVHGWCGTSVHSLAQHFSAVCYMQESPDFTPCGRKASMEPVYRKEI